MPISQQNKDDIKIQVNDFCIAIQRNSKRDFLSYRIDHIENVFNRYETLRDKVKPNMKITPASSVQIDRHKVGALMLLALIKENFIILKPNQKYNDIELHRNIYLGYLLAKVIIKDFYKVDVANQDPNVDELDISEKSKYHIHFKKLIMANKNLLDSISANNSSDINAVFFLSHIFYHMEQNFILATKEKNNQI